MNTTALLLSTLLITHTAPAFAAPKPNVNPVPNTKNQAAPVDESPSPQEVQQTAKKITVRITSEKNGGSGVLIAKKGSTYLVLTNAHVARRATQFQIQAPDGQKYTAKKIDGGFDAKYDLALLQFSSKTKYTLADLTDVASPLAPERTIYSAGFPFDSKDIRITSGQVTQLSDIPFDDGTQIGYTIDKGKKGIRQGMSGGAILDGRGKFLGINTLSNAPILPNYTYNDGSKPLPKLVARYQQANWGVPVYNFLAKVKPEILYSYDGLPPVEQTVTPKGYFAGLNSQARQMTVRIEADGGNGSGVVIAKEGNSYYVLTAKHVVQDATTKQKFINTKIITYDQEQYFPTSTVLAKGVDLAVVKFSSKNSYPPAQLGDYNPNDNALTFVGGFPARENIRSPLWQWQLNAGAISDRETSKTLTQDNQSFSNGYDLLYTNISYGGMSGGPVLDTAGNLIGLHGRAEGDQEGSKDIILGRSLGISIQTFTGLLSQLQVKPQLLKLSKNRRAKLSLEEQKTVIAAAFKLTKPSENSENSDEKQWLEYANQLYRITKFNESVKAFGKAITKGQKLRGYYGRSLALSNLEKLELANKDITEAIKIVPKGQEAKYYYLWKYKSLFLRDLGKYDESLIAIDNAIKLNEKDYNLLSEKASLLSSKKQFAKAIQIYNKIISENPEAYLYSNRGLVKSISGDKKSAVIDYDKAIELNPKYATAYSNRGITKFELGDKIGAISDFEQAIKIDPGSAIAYSNRGLAKFQSGDKVEAISDYNKAIELDDKFANAYFNRGSYKYYAGDKQGAIADYDKALKINPAYTSVYTNRGLAKFELGDRSGALSDYNQALKVDSGFANAYFNRGNAKYSLGDKKGAITDYNQAIKFNPKYAKAYNNRGHVKGELGDGQGAIIDFNQAVIYDPEYTKAYSRRGLAKYSLGDIKGAINDFTKTAELARQQGDMKLYQTTINTINELKGTSGKK
jgi:tetratricopeptide (TPR) repeat protein/S1-C subfamily serine protease